MILFWRNAGSSANQIAQMTQLGITGGKEVQRPKQGGTEGSTVAVSIVMKCLHLGDCELYFLEFID